MVSVHHAKAPILGCLFAWRRRTRTTRAEREEKRGGEAIARCSCEGSARRLAEGAPSGFRQNPFISTKPALLELLLFQRRFRRNGSIAGLQEKRGYPLKDSLSFLLFRFFFCRIILYEKFSHNFYKTRNILYPSIF